MDIVGFEIKNFKGISQATINFSRHPNARVHTLVGLNESGKTTLLEAIHSFSPDADTEIVVKGSTSAEEQKDQWVPRDKFAIFTGEVSVMAFVEANGSDWEAIAEEFRQFDGFQVDRSVLPNSFTMRLVHEYANGNFIISRMNLNIPNLQIKRKGGRKFETPNGDDLMKITRRIRSRLPTIAYYPNFVFDFPDKIYITDRLKSAKNRFYRQLFEDILEYDGSGYTIKESILDRIHREDTIGPWENWFSIFSGSTEEAKIRQVISRASRTVTNVVFSKWNEVFGEGTRGKRIEIELQYEKGVVGRDSRGVEVEPKRHDAYIRFKVLDGADPYDIDDRSLGFRWFFSFLIFTQFRLKREQAQSTIFLFDEPASNLHAAAQTKLLESFPHIATQPHRLLYSTHSHYMIDPKCLEQAYIVYNTKSSAESGVLESATSDSSDVKVVPYRVFVHENPSKATYFQPILDTLAVRPSAFDLRQSGIIVEGKDDFFGLTLAKRVSGSDDYPIFPGMGSGTLAALVALHRGWGLPVHVLFDCDKGGNDGIKKLRRELLLQDSSIHKLNEFHQSLKSIEDLISEDDKAKITGGSRKKSDVSRRVQEIVASNESIVFSFETEERMRKLAIGIRDVDLPPPTGPVGMLVDRGPLGQRSGRGC